MHVLRVLSRLRLTFAHQDLLRKTIEDATLIDSLRIDLENERDSRIRYQKELRDLVERKSNADLILVLGLLDA